METYDVCIVGAGILGAAAARELSRYELRLLWLEKAPDVGTGITRGNTSIIHGGFDDDTNSVKGRYAPRGAALIAAANEQLNFGFRKCGSLVLTFAAAEKLQALLENGSENGVPGLELWSRDELRAREPNINREATCALYARESGVVIAPEFCIALAENAVANGAELHLDEELRAVRQVPSGYELETSTINEASRQYRCRYFVNAAGWGAPAISQMLGVLDYQLQAVKGQYLVFDRSCGQMLNHVLFAEPDKLKGKGVTVCPTYHGNLLLGPDAEFTSDPSDLSTHLDSLQKIYHKGKNLLPGIPRARVICSYAGMRPRLKRRGHLASGDFLLRYRHDRCELLGIASPGLTAALPIARELAQKVAGFWRQQGRTLQQKINFQPERRPYIGSQRRKNFLSGKDLQLRTTLPLDDPECLICRCEQVSSRVLQEAVRRRGVFAEVAHNIDFLKWRTRVTMGFCQGKFCRPRIKKLLALLAAEEQTNRNATRHRREASKRVPPELLRREL